jgi:DNA polymerase
MERIEPQLPINFNTLAIIGESPGKNEIEQGIPFVGRSGGLLNTVLAEVGIERPACLVTNVFLSRPENDKIDRFFRMQEDADAEFTARYGLYRNRVVKDDNRVDMERLDNELAEHQPKVILLLGATALWRIMRANGITAARGNWSLVQLPRVEHLVGVMPTWHPSAVLRDRNTKLAEFVSDIQQVKAVLDGLTTP